MVGLYRNNVKVNDGLRCLDRKSVGPCRSPSSDFNSGIRRFESSRPSQHSGIAFTGQRSGLAPEPDSEYDHDRHEHYDKDGQGNGVPSHCNFMPIVV